MVRPSVVGKWASSICMALSCSKTERGVSPGGFEPQLLAQSSVETKGQESDEDMGFDAVLVTVEDRTQAEICFDHLHAVGTLVPRVAELALVAFRERRVAFKIRARQIVDQHLELRKRQEPPRPAKPPPRLQPSPKTGVQSTLQRVLPGRALIEDPTEPIAIVQPATKRSIRGRDFPPAGPRSNKGEIAAPFEHTSNAYGSASKWNRCL